MKPHRIIVVIPVADRPQHIRACLDSLLAQQRRFPYAGAIEVLIADDSADDANVAANRTIAAGYSARGLATAHFGPAQQLDLIRPLQATLPAVVGRATPERFGHKGQGVMRNIAYLHLARRLAVAPDERVLIWSVDSDQEFRVNLPADDGYVVDFFNGIDAIFSRTNAEVLTGKVVGDPPVSPAVMTRNFLDDVLAFLDDMAPRHPEAACGHHATGVAAGDAAYHDMADLFGFQPAASYAYPCPLPGEHSEADCFANFASRVNSFFYGEHPTRISRYQPGDLFDSVQPARTVYAGNYVFRPSALKYFIPFAALRLRMSGPTLGRIIRAELGPRFVSANLPMLHKRTVASGGQSEFRPGIDTQAQHIDMSGEFERQFYGDVMLFSTERRLAGADIGAALDSTRAELLEKYNERQRAILGRLAVLERLAHDPAHWWQRDARLRPALERIDAFAANVRRNFGDDSSGHARINAASGWQRWREDLRAAVEHYAADRCAWEQALCGR